MGEGVFNRDICEIVSGSAAEWSTARGKQQSSNAVLVVGGTKTLMNCTMFAVNRDEFGARRTARHLHHWASGNERFFVGECETSTGLERCQSYRQTGKPDDTVHHNIGLEREARHCVASRPNLNTWEFGRNRSGSFGVANRYHRGAIATGLFDDHFRLATCGADGAEFETVCFCFDDLKRLCTDRTGRTGESDTGQ
jgi:hypothetical protein